MNGKQNIENCGGNQVVVQRNAKSSVIDMPVPFLYNVRIIRITDLNKVFC